MNAATSQKIIDLFVYNIQVFKMLLPAIFLGHRLGHAYGMLCKHAR